MKRILLALALFILSVSQAAVAKELKIGLTLGKTGKFSKVAWNQENAYKLWQDKVNKRGGLLGRKVKFVIYDDKSDKKIAPSLYEKLITEDKVDIVFGPYSSGITGAVSPIVEKYKMPMLAPGAASDKVWQKNYKYVFGIWRPASRYTQGFMEMLLTYGIDNVAVIGADDSFSTSLFNGAKKWAEILELKTVHSEQFKKGTRNLAVQARNAKESGADVVVMLGHYDESADMRKAFTKIGWYPKAYIATVGPAMSVYYDEFKKDADYSFSVANWEPHERLKLPGAQAFKKDFQMRFKRVPSYHAATAFAAGEILEKAIKEAKGLDNEKLRRALATLETTTILGRYGVDRTGMQTKHFPVIVQWINGKKEIVWPEELQTAKPMFVE